MRAKGEGSIFQTKNNGKTVWCASTSVVGDDGERRFIRGYGATKQEAISRRSRNTQKRLAQPRTRSNAPTVAEYTAEFLKRNTTAQDSTLLKYRGDLMNHIVPHIGSIRIDALTHERLHDLFYEDLKTVGTSARKHAYTTFRTVLNHAVKHDIIAKSPLTRVDAPKHITVVSQADDRDINRRVSVAHHLIDWISAPENPYHDHYPRILMMYLGLRRAEVLGLTWNRVNQLTRANKSTIVIAQQLAWNKGEGWSIKPSTKNGKTRTIHLPERWRKALISEQRKNRTTNAAWSNDLVFKTPKGTHYTYKEHNDVWHEILTAYYNKGRRRPKPMTDAEYFRPHAMRHIAASMLFHERVPLEVAQEILGHSDKATAYYYTHHLTEARKEATDALNRTLKR